MKRADCPHCQEEGCVSREEFAAVQAALTRVRAALQKIAAGADNHWCRIEARAALEGRE